MIGGQEQNDAERALHLCPLCGQEVATGITRTGAARPCDGCVLQRVTELREFQGSIMGAIRMEKDKRRELEDYGVCDPRPQAAWGEIGRKVQAPRRNAMERLADIVASAITWAVVLGVGLGALYGAGWLLGKVLEGLR